MHQKRIGGRIANELLMLLRSEKKRNREVSIYEPVGVDKEGNAVTFMDVIENGEKEIPEIILENEEIKRMYDAYLSCLDEREQIVLKYRYGLFGLKEHTQKEIAHSLGISRSYISRIEKSALEKMKIKMEN
ncbi:MAG: sigma-70 family RNA polymerase sigma factor [Lachnospiraceae bacterium]